ATWFISAHISAYRPPHARGSAPPGGMNRQAAENSTACSPDRKGTASRPRFPSRAALVRQPIAQAALRPSVRPDVGVQAARGAVAPEIFVSAPSLLLPSPREIEIAELAVPSARFLVVGFGGFLRCGKVWAPPGTIADRRAESARPDLLDPTK